jgi:hypothetical protein
LGIKRRARENAIRDAGLHLLHSLKKSPRQSLESLSGQGFKVGPARFVFHAGEQRSRELSHMVPKYAGGPDDRTCSTGFEKRRLLRLRERQARALSETLVLGD